MGDNLAPDLYARTFNAKGLNRCRDHTTYSDYIHVPKEFLNYVTSKTGKNGTWRLWCSEEDVSSAPFSDNVAQFFIEAKYDALVPGKHDFYFGAEYLNQIAHFLESQANPVRMLGSNLVVTTSVAPGTMNAHPRIPEQFWRDCHDNTHIGKGCYHTDFGQASLDLPESVLPWKRQFVLHGARRAFIRDQHPDTLYRTDELSTFKSSKVQYLSVFDETRTQICEEHGPPTNSDPSNLVNPKCFEMIASDVACGENMDPGNLATCKSLFPKSKGLYKADADEDKATTDVTFLFKHPKDHLTPGLNHMFCTYPAQGIHQFKNSKAEKEEPICQPFAVQIPFFWANNGDAPSRSADFKYCEQYSEGHPCPFALVKREGSTVAVFGVVDPDLLSNVGMLNTNWLNKHGQWDTATRVTAPDYALLQTLELCNSMESCRTAPKVLMAQMSPSRASQLISASAFPKFFDVVITQASLEHDTGAQNGAFRGDAPRFILTPPFSTGKDKTFKASVYFAKLSKETPPTCALRSVEELQCAAEKDKPAVEWSLSNQPLQFVPSPDSKSPASTQNEPCPAVDEPGKPPCWNLQRFSLRWLLKKGANGDQQLEPVSDPSAGDAFQKTVLLVMRNSLQTDAAIMQKRDLFDPDNSSYVRIDGRNVQDQISRILWKDDFALRIHLTGATIRKMLKQSAAFAEQDQNALTTEIETGRSLITLGIYKDPKNSDNYFINGALMDDSKLYSIATTDFIAGGTQATRI